MIDANICIYIIKNKPIPQKAIKIWGDDNLAVYKYIED